MAELTSLEDAILRRERLDNPEYWAEESLARAADGTPYSWDDNTAIGELALESGLRVKTCGNLKNSTVVFEISFEDRGVQDRARVSKFISTAATQCKSILKNGGWLIIGNLAGGRSALVKAEIAVTDIRKNEKSALKSIEEAYNCFIFD